MKVSLCVLTALLALALHAVPAFAQTPVPATPTDTPTPTPTPASTLATNTSSVPEPPVDPVVLISTIFGVGFFLALALPASLLIYATFAPLEDSDKERAKILEKARKKSEKKEVKSAKKDAKLKDL